MNLYLEKNEITETNQTELMQSRITEESSVLNHSKEMNNSMLYLYSSNNYAPFQHHPNTNTNMNNSNNNKNNNYNN